MKCYKCNESGDLRPYGPKGAMVCFPCATSSPEAKAETERNFAAQLNAIDGPIVLDGSNAGPYPLKHFLNSRGHS